MIDPKYSVPINRTKLYRPVVTADYISRDALDACLDEGIELPLTLVCAAAGYGKSTLISHWLETHNIPNAWLSLDDSENDVRIFLSYFVAALRTVSVEACNKTFNSVNAESLPPMLTLVTQLSNDLDDLDKDLILVLDDYHRIRDNDIHYILDCLLEHPSLNLHLIILSRRDPTLSLAPLRANHLLNEIRMQELKFSSEDTLTFLAKTIKYPLQASNIKRLQDRTEGWPVGIRLAALALAHQDNIEDYLNQFGADSRPLQEYLIVEVLSGQPPAVQDSLLNISIFDRFNASLCESVCNNTVTGKDTPSFGLNFIEILENSGLFCIALDEQSEWFRFHHLFADLLYKQLEERRGSKEISRLHQIASNWFAENTYFEEAIHHALAGGDVEHAVEIVGSARQGMMNRDQWHRLELWLNLFPHEAVQQYPHLMLLRCWLDLYYRYRLDYLVKDLAQVDILLENPVHDVGEADQLKAEVAAIRSNLAYWILKPELGVDLAKQALRDTPDSYECIRSTALFGWGALCQMLGDEQLGARLIWDHMEDGRFSCQSSRARLMLTLCMTYWPVTGAQKFPQAASTLLQISLEHELPWSLSFSRYFFGLIHYEQNELSEAVAHLKIIVDDPYRYPIQNVTHCAFLLSLCYQAQALPDRAREVADSIYKFTFERGNKMFIELVEAFQADLNVRQGRIAQAEHWLKSYALPTPHALQRFYNAELTSIRVLMALDTPQSRATATEQLDTFHQQVIKIHHKRLLIDVLGMKALLAETNGDKDSAVALLHEAVLLGLPGQLIRPLVDVGRGLVKPLNRLHLNQEGLHYVGKILAALSKEYLVLPANNDTNKHHNSNQPPLLSSLTNREQEILQLINNNLTNKDIAEKLFISPRTVKRHAESIYSKLGVHRRQEAIAKANGLGLLETQ